MRGNITEEEMEGLVLRDVTAPCKFCGQYVSFKWDPIRPISEDEEIEEASKNCSCESARWYQERDTKINLASENINDLFGDPDEAELRNLFLYAVKMIIDKAVFKITATARNGAKGEFSITASDKIKIKRTEATVQEASL